LKRPQQDFRLEVLFRSVIQSTAIKQTETKPNQIVRSGNCHNTD